MSNDRTIIDVFEEVLGVAFDPRWTKKISIDVPVARRLARAVKPYYESFRLPEKDPGEMRPYLFPGYTTGRQLLNSFGRREHRFLSSPDTDLLLLKPFLLYAHGICFYDPLPWIYRSVLQRNCGGYRTRKASSRTWKPNSQSRRARRWPSVMTGSSNSRRNRTC